MKAQSTVEPKKVEILGDKVLVKSNIELTTRTDEHGITDMYEYDEIRYKKDEYIRMIDEENKQLDGVIVDLIQLLSDKGVIF